MLDFFEHGRQRSRLGEEPIFETRQPETKVKLIFKF